MCVIIYKKAGVALPDKQFLKRAWSTNPDGGGYSYNTGSDVIYYKGFQSFKDFYNSLLTTATAVNLKATDLIIHFRIATSGGKTAQKTHPFVICKSYKTMEKLHGSAKNVFFHNGVINDFSSVNYSDSENFNFLVLAGIKNIDQQAPLIDYLARVNNSRFAIMHKNGVILGGDFLADGDLLVSNKNYNFLHNSSYNYYEKTRYNYNKQCYLYSDYNIYD